MVVGQGTCQPSYFLNEMQWWEVIHYIEGIHRKERVHWTTTRWLGWLYANSVSKEKIDSPEEMLTLPWEKSNADMPTIDEVEELRRQMIEENRFFTS